MVKFSLLLCTLNRKELLRKCVDSILCQSYSNFEIIIVDQSNSVNNELYLSDSRITYIHILTKGLSNARNVGLNYVKGDYICLLDDDAEYSKDWLQKVSIVINEDSAEIICGRIKDPYSGKYGLKGKLETAIDSVTYRKVMRFGISPCCVFEATALKSVGFDDRFGVGRRWGAGEETDTIWCIMEKGGRMKYVPQIEVIHPCPQKEDMPLNKIISYNLGFGALYAKHRMNPYIFLFSIESILRNIFGIIYFAIRGRINSVKIQKICLANKLRGFIEYIKAQ